MQSATESPCLVITAKNRYVRNNSSWVISRVLSDYEAWMDPAVRTRLERMLDERHYYMRSNTRKGTTVPRPGQTGLCISIYEPSGTKTAGEPAHDLVYWSGLGMTILQLVIAAIPMAVSEDWSIFMITAGVTTLALITGSLPRWRSEKWDCRRSSQNTYVLTRGNGRGLNLEDLAVAGKMKYPSSNAVTRTCLAGISIPWISLLIIAAGVKQNTWFLLAVGGIGVVQNVLVAGWRRKPGALGVHLDF